MTLLPEIAEVVAHIPPANGSRPDVAALRAAEASQVIPLADRVPLLEVEDQVAATGIGPVPVRLYTPVAAEPNGLLVYIHGGAFFLGSLDSHDHVARELAAATRWRVLSVGYRLAPEHPFPAGLDDVYSVTRWAVDHAGELAWNGDQLALVGDSSGGNLVAATVARAHDDGWDRISAQVLYYPSLDLTFDAARHPSLRENASGYGLETASLAPWNSFYVDSGADPTDPQVSPLRRADLSALPRALVITAQYDPMRDEGEAYAARLRQAGVPAVTHRYERANHGFVQFFSAVPQLHGVFAETAAFLRGD